MPTKKKASKVTRNPSHKKDLDLKNVKWLNLSQMPADFDVWTDELMVG